jgi:STE24 endopeptidase
MNIYTVIILSAVIIGFLLDIISELLNLKNLSTKLPKEFEDVYSSDDYKKSQEYTKVNTKFGFISSTFSLIVLLFFWFLGGFPSINEFVVTKIDGTIWQGLAFIGIIVFVQTVLSLPFSIYSTFVIEEKFGFNKTTPKTFISDILKSLFLSLLIGAPVLAGIIFLLDNTGANAWLYAWAGVVVFMLFIQYIAPTVIMPMFNKFKPLEDEELKTAIMNYAGKVNFPLKNVFEIDGSKRSSKSNAFFTGFGKNKRIALFDTLIKNHTKDEIVAVLAHEIGHYKKKHIHKSLVISILHMGLLFYLLSLFIYNVDLYAAFFMTATPVYAGLLFFGMLYSPVEMILSVLMNIFSRKNEYEADRFAAETISNPVHMINALKKLSKDNLSNLTPHPFYVFVNYSHPPVIQRIKAIKMKS